MTSQSNSTHLIKVIPLDSTHYYYSKIIIKHLKYQKIIYTIEIDCNKFIHKFKSLCDVANSLINCELSCAMTYVLSYTMPVLMHLTVCIFKVCTNCKKTNFLLFY